jgi:(E)-2-((N-methylformamido)methylene)succinate hydrolase
MTKPQVVFLHGVGLDHHMWVPTIDELGDRFEGVAPDLLGHGAADPAPTGVTLADLAEAASVAIERPSHLVGFSLGALVAQHLARYRPELVATLTSVNSVCRRTDEERASVLSRLDTAASEYGASVEASLKRWYEGTDTDPEWVQWTEATLRANDVDSYLNCYRVFATADAEIAPELSRITVPALAITGEDDPGSTPDMTYRLAEAIPDCRAIVVPGARHMLPVQCPREFANHLVNFVGENSDA